jgi:hypothetical protein
MQPAATLPRVLIAQHTDIALMIPAQPVRAEPSIMAVVDGSKRTLAHHGRPDQSINLLNGLDLRLDDTHLFKNIRLPRGTSMGSIFYNTVILVCRSQWALSPYIGSVFVQNALGIAILVFVKGTPREADILT